MKIDTLEPAKKFVDSLQDILMHDPDISKWLLPLEPLLQSSYRNRFRIVEGQAHYLVYDDDFEQGHLWLDSEQYYKRASKKIREILKQNDMIRDDTQTGAD
jgi:hypothetical protein